jgi:ribonucleotide monophosphatase NagD (HAD superfamily)
MDRALEPVPRLVIFDLDGVVYRGREPVPGAAALVAGLRERGTLIRFATNNSMATRETYVAELTEMGIATELGEIVTSTSATIGKPQPGIFQAILERAGVEPGEALAIGDNPAADMVAAHRAGIASILVLTGVADAAAAAALSGEQRPDRVARDPAEVATILRLTLS